MGLLTLGECANFLSGLFCVLVLVLGAVIDYVCKDLCHVWLY